MLQCGGGLKNNIQSAVRCTSHQIKMFKSAGPNIRFDPNNYDQFGNVDALFSSIYIKLICGK